MMLWALSMISLFTTISGQRAQSQDVQMIVTVDNILDNVYADGDRLTMGPQAGDWTKVDRLSIPSTTQVIALEATDTGVVCGIVAAFDTGEVTDTSWKCSATYQQGWELPGFDDSGWADAHDFGKGTNPGWRTNDDDNLSASHWIWHTQGCRRRKAYCRMRREILQSTVPGHSIHSHSESQCRLDVCFLLDVSSSIFASNFRYIRQYVSLYTQSFHIGPDKTQIGAITFAKTPKLEFALNTSSDVEAVKATVNNIVYRDESFTYLTEGIKFTRTVCFDSAKGDRPPVKNLMVIVTDGNPEDHTAASEQALLARQQGIEIIVVGIGESIDQNILNDIANGAKNVFMSDTFTGLHDKTLKNIVELSCEKSKTCNLETMKPGYPALSGCPVLHKPEVVEDLYVQFTCEVNASRPTDVSLIRNSRYKVTWLLDDQPHGEPEVLELEFFGQPKAYIRESSLVGHLNKTLSCEVQPYYANSDASTIATAPRFYSRRYWMGMVPSEIIISLRESDKEPYRLFLYNTLPIPCHSKINNKLTGCELRFLVRTTGDVAVYQKPLSPTSALKETDKCLFSQNRTDWNTDEALSYDVSRPLYIMARADRRMRKRPRLAEINIEFIQRPQKEYSNDKGEKVQYIEMWKNYRMDTIKVYIYDDRPSVCKAIGDPHLTTFDLFRYDSMDEGPYTYAKATGIFDFEIQLQHFSCTDVAHYHCAVVCAVAVREEADVFVLDNCHLNGGFSGAIRRNRPLQPDPNVGIYERNNKDYTIKTIGGIEVRVHLRIWYKNDHVFHYTNVYIHLPAKYNEETEGACGNFDGHSGNDISSPITRHMAKWSVPANESLFTRQMYDHQTAKVRLENLCDCSRKHLSDTVGLGSASQCGMLALKTEEGISERLVKSLIPRDIANLGRRRRRRSTSRQREQLRDDVNYDYSPANVPFRPVVNFTLPDWGSLGVTLEQAQEACYQKILGLPSYSTCATVIDNGAINDLVESCLTDIQLTGDLAWVADIKSGFESQCEQDIVATAVIEDEQDTAALNQLQEKLQQFRDTVCVTNCTNHGHCQNEQCICDQGYFGPDCMSTADTLPEISAYLGPDACDVAEHLCQSVQLRGSDFVASDNFKCRVHITTASGLTDTLTTTAELYTDEIALCPLPDLLTYTTSGDPLYVYTVQLSNDGVQFVDAQATRRIVVDTLCMDCVDTSCTQKADTCIYRGQCYLPGDSEPSGDGCMVCDPSYNTEKLRNLREAGEQHGVVYGMTNVDVEQVQEASESITQIVSEVLEEYCQDKVDECCSALDESTKSSPDAGFNFKSSNVKVACGYPKYVNLTHTSLLLSVEVPVSQLSRVCDPRPGLQVQRVFLSQDTLGKVLNGGIIPLQNYFNETELSVNVKHATSAPMPPSPGPHFTSTPISSTTSDAHPLHVRGAGLVVIFMIAFVFEVCANVRYL